uniref:Ovule protein n=1 Tax=Syphacia muris TaxID=451379 RepID=A0A0N5AC06_9BILA
MVLRLLRQQLLSMTSLVENLKFIFQQCSGIYKHLDFDPSLRVVVFSIEVITVDVINSLSDC